MKKNTLLILLVVLISLAILLPASLSPNLFILKPFGLNEVAQLLTFLILIALFLERALEVFITTWRGPEEEKIDNEIQHHERKIIEIKDHIERQSKQPEISARVEEVVSTDPPKAKVETEVRQSSEDVSELRNELDEEMTILSTYNLKRSEYKAKTRKIALWSALFIGLLISAVGIRSLETLVELRSFPDQKVILYNGQVFVFRCLDTLLTGGLIAGGSDGIHKITQVFTAFLEHTSKQIKDKST
ncbi:MAG: hypothetical protein L0Y56_00195 [Nitrospira sp.]|nr:hypothetical protein [Nitrospira sp.]